MFEYTEGTLVRSYDFPDQNDYYVEGVVCGVAQFCDPDTLRYCIKVHRWVVGGKEAANFTQRVYPRVDGRIELI